ncbi:hypothetical protein DDZ13_00765 [Coraliomargarita sinensis]|uniref:Porin n=1 Tax=Coraliomargarita sinensis TaxID=2174842 RepID=A0A317ZK88_9BACT|nr:outer membrane beta-barrel protein [Coraliomargarita sinensis]PXA05432.1 hypothetical protein DDZ13_00765 [Coraliomargarita sinensis]
MKNSIALASAFLAASSASTAEIVINDWLSFEGFVDMSYVHYEGDVDATLDGTDAELTESGNSYQVDQVEISWLFDFDPVTAQIDLQYEDLPGDSTAVEQAFATYHFDNGGAITAGRYASMLGFEAFEPTGLYQYSTAYGLPATAGELTGLIPGPIDTFLGPLTATAFPIGARYSQGVKYTYDGDDTFFGISIQDGINLYSDRLGGDPNGFDNGGYGVEVAGSYYMDNGLSFFLGGAYEDGDGIAVGGTPVTGDTESIILNSYVTFETGAWLFAFELFYGENELEDIVIAPGSSAETESFGGLLMANFAYSDKASVTGRLSYTDFDIEGSTTVPTPINGSADAEMLKLTLAHSYAFTDNLLLVTEVSYSDIDADGSASDGIDTLSADADFDELLGAVELIFSF